MPGWQGYLEAWGWLSHQQNQSIGGHYQHGMARRLFGEGGSVSKKEADELQKVLERSSQRTDALKDSLRVDMEALESSSLEQVRGDESFPIFIQERSKRLPRTNKNNKWFQMFGSNPDLDQNTRFLRTANEMLLLAGEDLYNKREFDQWAERIGSGPPSSLSLADGTTTSTVTMATNNKPITTASANATSAVTVATSSSGQTWVTVEPCLDATTTAGSVSSRYTRTSSCTETEL
ncbi:hypothetical protein NHX12_029145 [Muraenolepis orangiensis]|uniref:Uncharacterized protein n=1 Tax=Muraenolepis orangiensis TaxID=630683 RepID=A0A9Q0IMW2_9TELE|nr:hypothetical protein NHX12_029145 [Muraenolepis orangiensis]